MKNNINKVIIANILILVIGFALTFAATRMSVNKELKNQEMHQYLLTDTEQTKEEIAARLDSIQEQIDEMNQKIDDLKEDQTDTKILEMQIEMNEVEKIEDLKEYYLTYIDVVNKYSDYIQPPETIYDAYSQAEIYQLWCMVETETSGADFESRTHVANVAFNRVADPKYPDTLSGVITAPGQFASTKKNISETTKLACEYAYMFPDNTGGALAFHSGEIGPTFCGMNLIFVDTCGHGLYGRTEEE